MSKLLAVALLVLTGCFLPALEMPRADRHRPPWKHTGAYDSPCHLAATDDPEFFRFWPHTLCMECRHALELGDPLPRICNYALGDRSGWDRGSTAAAE